MVLKRSHGQTITARRSLNHNPQHYPNINPDHVFVPAGHDKNGPLVTFMRRNDEENYEYDKEHYNRPFKHGRGRPSGERARRTHIEMEQGDGKVFDHAEEGGPAQAPMRHSEAHGGKKQAAAEDAKREEKKRQGRRDGKGKSRADVSDDGRGDDSPAEMRHSKAREGKKKVATKDAE
ncbi:hypothetical protein N0V94_009113 [Neodidymelliopsis sp. IMI 364377]|nr:hypothetical protein N0V94_009113 [Neodidymelliopsis sp. IMI 364377]